MSVGRRSARYAVVVLAAVAMLVAGRGGLAAGASVDVKVRIVWPRVWVYRFYNRRTYVHFYTADESERERVRQTLGDTFIYEGAAYQAFGRPGSGAIPLFRFYHRRAGVHFYTADANELVRVQTQLGHIYTYEGTAYWVAGSGSTPVYRFFYPEKGVHFYTADPGERDDVIRRFSHIYAYEGVAFSLP